MRKNNLNRHNIIDIMRSYYPEKGNFLLFFFSFLSFLFLSGVFYLNKSNIAWKMLLCNVCFIKKCILLRHFL